MKNIFLLRFSIIAFMTLILLGNFANLYLSFNELVEIDFRTIVLSSGLTFLFIVGLLYVQKALLLFSRNQFFTQKSISLLKTSAYCLILFSLSSIIFNTYNIISTEALIANYILYALICLIGFGLICFTNVLKEGKYLKQENELTI